MSVLRFTREDRSRQLYLGILLTVLLLAVIGPWIVPYEADEYNFDESGDLRAAESPSVDHPLGTTATGFDVLTRLVIGARPTIITGVLGGLTLITIGSVIGITAGYKGGTVDNVLMRFTDLVYGIPLIPFAIVLVAFFGTGFFQTIFIIGAVLWRGSARVLRSQVLQIKEREFILAVKAEGGGSLYVIRNHIVPNILPMMAFFFAVGMGATIIIQAGLSFIGVSNPFVPSWGIMIRNAFDAGHIDSWWWSLPPGILISAIVYSSIMLGRSIESTDESNETEGLTGV
ncbi:MAG: ABC transporter permease [Halovenus sp.]